MFQKGGIPLPVKRQAPPPAPEQPLLPGEELPKKEPSVVKRFLLRLITVAAAVLALALCYLFLLMGEPDEDAKLAADLPAEAAITMPMSPFEAPGESNVQNLADTFGQPVMALYGGLTMQKARIYDTAFEGGYARRATLTYTFEDGQQLTVESLRPTSAVRLIKEEGFTLDAAALYTLGGLNAARMENSSTLCVFAQTDTAVYAVRCPASHADELSGLIKQCTLIEPSASQP